MEQISLHILECYLIKVMTANKHSESILLPHHLQFGITLVLAWDYTFLFQCKGLEC